MSSSRFDSSNPGSLLPQFFQDVTERFSLESVQKNDLDLALPGNDRYMQVEHRYASARNPLPGVQLLVRSA